MINKIRFAHIADIHLGSYRENYLKYLNFLAFKKTIDKIIEKNVDFLLIAGDIFNTPLPNIELVEEFVKEIKRLKEKNIPIYFIGGSHDYSDLGKSYLSLFDTIDLMKNVFRYKIVDKSKYELEPIVIDEKKVLITGVVGRKKEKEKEILLNLKINNIEKYKDYFKIFMFHTSLNDFKPKNLENINFTINTSFLPKNFDYYAGGHIHTHKIGQLNGGKISYSGVLFPNNFFELKTQKPTFNICEYDFEKKDLTIIKEELNFYKIKHVKFNLTNLNPNDAKNKILKEIEKENFQEKIVLLELEGVVDGKIKDIRIGEIIDKFLDLGAKIVLRNTYKLVSKEIEIDQNVKIQSTKEIENILINKYLEDINNTKYLKITKDLFQIDLSKQEEEKNKEYEQRINLIFSNLFDK